ncbi:carbohydrate kinase [Mucilaginibacter hurinus]|uniref:Carbohydrate kinase n=1 Tax=Mucilaginibacter hurinus TaxID=2201324 RepID=A0A367GMY6_9SPHI|nr:carbohydrate kinase [Mucilaginibacter hurinus]RCH54837.1 carbohydrate kinase [Mucilaginibacter hurinus]
MKNHVLCFGEVLWDTFTDGKKPGGAPMNVAQHLAQQGHEVSLVSRIGKDNSGKKLAEFLKKNDLYGKHVQRDDELPTCEVTVKLDDSNQATYTIPQPVSWDNIKVENGLKKHARKAAAIVYGSLASRSKKTRNTLQTLLDETTALKIFDVNLRAPHYNLENIDILAAKANVVKMNEEEASLLVGGHADQLKNNIQEFQKKYHAKTIVVTRGDKGAMVWHDEKFYEHPGFSVNVVDTVGAGDAFLATLISGILKDRPMDLVLEKACAIGAYVAGKRGANPEYDKDEIKTIKGIAAA